MLHSLSNLSTAAVMDRIRDFSNVSFQLGLEEAHEMTRGNLLHIFARETAFQRSL